MPDTFPEVSQSISYLISIRGRTLNPIVAGSIRQLRYMVVVWIAVRTDDVVYELRPESTRSLIITKRQSGIFRLDPNKDIKLVNIGNHCCPPCTRSFNL